MPRWRKAAPRRLTAAQRAALVGGPIFGTLEEAFGGEDQAREAWGQHRAELLAQHPPGSRPWAWWRWDAPPWHRPEPRPPGLRLAPGADQPPIVPWDEEAVLRALGELS